MKSWLCERAKAGKFDTKGKIEQMTDIIRRLRVCVKWFQQVDETHLQEKETLRSSLESAEKIFSDKEELQATIAEMKEKIVSLQEKFSKEELSKLDAIENHKREKECRAAAEKLGDSLRGELDKAKEEIMAGKHKEMPMKDINTRLQEYSTGSQQYNSKLQTGLEAVREAQTRAEKEKSSILENLTTLRSHSKSLQDQLASSQESLLTEVKNLRSELQQVGDDRDRHVAQSQKLADGILKYKESVGKSSRELDILIGKSGSLEETCSLQKERMKMLEQELTFAKEKLKMVDASMSLTMTEFGEQQIDIAKRSTKWKA
ncbi:unnamed protein product [Eruca vesicaria subsp. sativa]|uniref:Uncharacterized protein n=1 Tax=Eruca vesicaria subsp. sativa TaxID=29727 RepID=A0ABC8KQM0_ERUVS|nr:unnamed protein product [Eruca vesicaria subsp. sativa]